GFFPFLASSCRRRFSFLRKFAHLAEAEPPEAVAGAGPAPVGVTSVGELLSLLVTRSIALRGPSDPGGEWAFTKQAPPAGVTLIVQLSPVFSKSPAFGPAIATPVTSSGELLVLSTTNASIPLRPPTWVSPNECDGGVTDWVAVTAIPHAPWTADASV